MNRREFIKAAGYTAAGLAAGGGISLIIPSGEKISQIPYPNPGWLETSLPDRPPFLSVWNEGHRDYLVYMCQKNPALKEIMQDSYKDMLFDPITQKPLLGNYFASHVERAGKIIKKYFHDPNIDSDQPSLANKIHCAFFTVAAALHAGIHDESFN